MTFASRVAAVALGAVTLLATTNEARALDGARLPTQHIQDAWAEREGLPQNSVKAIAQTDDGMLWIGTEEGLVRFDGKTLRVFDRTRTTGRTTNPVTALAVDDSGELTLLGAKDGLCTFRDPSFTCARLPDDATATSLRLGPRRHLYVTSDRGLFERSEGTLRRVASLGTSAVRDVAFDPVIGPVVAITAGQGAVAIEGGNAVPIDLGGLAPEDIHSVTRLRDGAIWFGTRRGVRVLEGRRLVPTSLRDAPPGDVRFVFGDADGTVWLSLFDDGLYRTRGDAIVRVPLAAGQASERLDAAFEDDEGNVWIGSRLSGLHRLRDGPFVPWGVPEGLGHGFVHAVFAAANGDILVAAAGGGLYVVRGDQVLHPGHADGFPEEGVDGFAPGKDGTVLVATRRGLFRITSFEPLRGAIVPEGRGMEVNSALEEESELWIGTTQGLHATRSGKSYGAADGLSSSWVGALMRDAEGTLWIATEGGLFRMRGTTFDDPFRAALGRAGISTFFTPKAGTFFVGTSDVGIAMVRGSELRLLDRKHGLFDDTAHALLDGADGRLWVSTNKGVYTVPLAELDAWSKGERTEVTARTYGRESGMRSRECNGGIPAAARDPRGRLWFATMQGVVSVDPTKLREPPPPRTPVFDAARVADRVVIMPSRVVLPPDTRALSVSFTVAALGGVEPTCEVRLVGGADDAWHTVVERTATFPSFGPGSYAIEVRARDALGRASPGVARLTIEVPARFVETSVFRAGALLLGAALLGAVGLARLRSVERARQRLAEVVDERTRDLAMRNADLEARTGELRAALEDPKRAETELVRAEKMASVATLVRGIAHELNNPLAFVTANVAPLRRYVTFLLGAIHEVGTGAKTVAELRLSPKKDLAFVERDLPKLLADMEEGGRRAKLIVGDLQSLTTVTSRTIEPVDLARIIDQSVRLLAPSTPEGVVIDVRTEPSPPFLAHAGELEQAVVVLLDNALRAVGAHGRVEVRLASSDDTRTVSVKDDGPGMTEDVRRRATEPFFTTREPGEGSGLGLAIACQIAEHHRGSLAIASALGEGTSVVLTVRSVT